MNNRTCKFKTRLFTPDIETLNLQTIAPVDISSTSSESHASTSGAESAEIKQRVLGYVILVICLK